MTPSELEALERVRKELWGGPWKKLWASIQIRGADGVEVRWDGPREAMKQTRDEKGYPQWLFPQFFCSYIGDGDLWFVIWDSPAGGQWIYECRMLVNNAFQPGTEYRIPPFNPWNTLS